MLSETILIVASNGVIRLHRSMANDRPHDQLYESLGHVYYFNILMPVTGLVIINAHEVLNYIR